MAITRGTLRIARRLRRDIGTEVDQVVRDLTTAWIKAWDELATPWQLAAADLVAEAVRLEHWPRPTDIARLPRVLAALDASEQALQGLAQQTADAAIAGAKRVIDADVELEARIIASQAPTVEQEGLLRHLTGRLPVAEQDQDEIRLQVNSRIRTDAVDVMRRRTAGQITADTFPLAPDAAEVMRRELIRGIDVGTNPREAAARMVANTEGAFNGGLTRAMVISRTEMMDAYRATSQQIHATNSDIVPAWEWLSELSLTTCPSCWSMHGEQFPVSTPGPDDHPVGRCARLPVLATWAELGISAPEPPNVTVDAEARFWALPRAQQLRIMGPGRLQMLENGSIGWGDLSKIRQNPGWRPSRIPTPLRELRQRVDRGLPPTLRPASFKRAAPPARLATPTLPIPATRVSVAQAQRHIRERMDNFTPFTRAQAQPVLEQQATLAPAAALRLQQVRIGDASDFVGPNETALAYYRMTGPEKYRIVAHPLWAAEQGGAGSPLRNVSRETVESGWLTPTGANSSLGHTLAHEYGHHIERAMFSDSGIGDPLDSARLLESIRDNLGIPLDITHSPRNPISTRGTFEGRLTAAVKASQPEIQRLVSQYATTNGHELLAEIWQEYSTLGDRARPHIRAIGQVMQELAEKGST